MISIALMVTLPTTVSSEKTGLCGLDALRSSFAEFIAMKFSKDPHKRAEADRIAGNVPVEYVLQTMEPPKKPEPLKEVKQDVIAKAKWSDGYQDKIVLVFGDEDNPPKAEFVNQWFSGVSVFGNLVPSWLIPVDGLVSLLGTSVWYRVCGYKCIQQISPTHVQTGRVY